MWKPYAPPRAPKARRRVIARRTDTGWLVWDSALGYLTVTPTKRPQARKSARRIVARRWHLGVV